MHLVHTVKYDGLVKVSIMISLLSSSTTAGCAVLSACWSIIFVKLKFFMIYPELISTFCAKHDVLK